MRMGKTRVIAETGAGQHGVATATACARFGLDCVVYMGEEDIRRQAPNVFSMQLLGAEVRPVTSGSRTLRDAINEAMRDWMASVETTHYILGSVVGPHPFPRIVRDFQSVIGRETIRAVPRATRPAARSGRRLRRRRQQRGRHVLSVRRRDRRASWWASRRADAVAEPGDHAAPLSYGQPGVLHGSFSYVMQDDDGQTCDVHSISAGLGLSRRRAGAQLLERHRPRANTRTAATTRPWHAFDAAGPQRRHPAGAGNLARRGQGHASWRPQLPPDEAIVVCLSGRGDKDAAEIARLRAASRLRTEHTCL